jgi:hypothetical protein
MAQSQQGFFTTKQAIRSGFAEKTHSYHVNAGNWIREHRGIYRLADFPAPERPDLLRLSPPGPSPVGGLTSGLRSGLSLHPPPEVRSLCAARLVSTPSRLEYRPRLARDCHLRFPRF